MTIGHSQYQQASKEGKLMRNRSFLSLVPLLAVASVGCNPKYDDRQVSSTAAGDSSAALSSDSAEKRDQSLVRVIHAVPGAPTVDVQAGDQVTFAAVPFKTVTPYQGVPDNRPKFTIRPSGEPAGQPLTENAELIMDGEYYTVVAFPKQDGAGLELEALRDDLTPANPAMARVRVVNAAARASNVDIVVDDGADPLFDDVGFEDEAGFKDVPPGTSTVTVTAPDSRRVLLRIADLDLKAGQSLTIVLTHPTAASSKIEAIRVVDELTRVAGR
jgi:hypothetical protein